MAETRKTALVTGASAGLGTELAWLFAADGRDLVLVARRRDKLDTLAKEIAKAHGVEATVIAEDLTDPGAPPRIARTVEERGIAVEYLVNNAGFGMTGAVADLDATRQLDMVQVNVTAVVHMTRLFLPGMLARRSGRVLNIGSTAGFLPGPFMAGYYASKAFVISFTEALWLELRGTGVTATVSCPGATATEFAQVAGNAESRLFRMGAMGAGEVALHAYRAMMSGRRLAVPGIKNKLGLQAQRVSPRSLLLRLAAALNGTRGASSSGPEPKARLDKGGSTPALPEVPSKTQAR
jgi:short-subunit dehydrogenase